MPQAIKVIWELGQGRCGLLNHKSKGKGEKPLKRGEGKYSFVLRWERAPYTQLDTIKSAKGPEGQGRERGPGKN